MPALRLHTLLLRWIMESVIKLSAMNPRSIEIRLIEGRDEAYIRVNEDYFSLGTGQKLSHQFQNQKLSRQLLPKHRKL